jgi:hypothetical protein
MEPEAKVVRAVLEELNRSLPDNDAGEDFASANCGWRVAALSQGLSFLALRSALEKRIRCSSFKLWHSKLWQSEGLRKKG